MTRTARDDGRRPQMRWVDLGGRGKYKRWQLAGTKYYVQHCGHPTALFPWYGLRPDGSMITAGPGGVVGYAFRCLDDAKLACELDLVGKRQQIGLFAAHRTKRALARATQAVVAAATRVRKSRRAS